MARECVSTPLLTVLLTEFARGLHRPTWGPVPLFSSHHHVPDEDRPPERDTNKKKALAAFVGAIATKTLGTLAADYLRDAIEQVTT